MVWWSLVRQMPYDVPNDEESGGRAEVGHRRVMVEGREDSLPNAKVLEQTQASSTPAHLFPDEPPACLSVRCRGLMLIAKQ